MEQEKQQVQKTAEQTAQKTTNPVTNSSPVEDNSSPDNDQQAESPRQDKTSNTRTEE